MRYQMLIAAALFSCSIDTTVPAEKPTADIINAPLVTPMIWKLLEDSGRGFRHSEQAAFLVAQADGRLALVRWPEPGEPDTSRWYGALPAGAVAIVHTHPNWAPLPSKIDIQTARQSHLPVYVVTASQISKTVGGEPQIVLNGDWNPKTRDNAGHEIDASGVSHRRCRVSAVDRLHHRPRAAVAARDLQIAA